MVLRPGGMPASDRAAGLRRGPAGYPGAGGDRAGIPCRLPAMSLPLPARTPYPGRCL
jgi:hypothetical protein